MNNSALRSLKSGNEGSTSFFRSFLRNRVSICSAISSASLRLELREEDHVADAFLAEEHHAEAVDTGCISDQTTSIKFWHAFSDSTQITQVLDSESEWNSRASFG